MAAGDRVFVARLAGTAVYEANNDQVGRVRDVVVTLRLPTRPPRVLGLVVEVMPRRRIFVPMSRVTRVDAGGVVTTGLVNLRRFEQRPGETLAIGELLDRTTTQRSTGEAAVVHDLAIEQQRGGRDWLVTRVAILKGRSGLRRRAQASVVDWDDVTGLTVDAGGQGVTNLLAVIERLRPADLANMLRDLAPRRRAELTAALDDERLADVLEELDPQEQQEILAGLEGERAADVLEEMSPDDAADLLSELPAEEQERLLSLMEEDDAEPLRRLLTYADYSAGGLMTSDPVIVTPDATVAEALARLRDPDITPAVASMVFVCRPPAETPTGRYLGLVHIQRLLRVAPSSLASAWLDTDIDPLDPDTSIEDLARYFATYNLVAVPVVDDQHRLLGAVSVDDVLDHLLPDEWRSRPGVAVTRRVQNALSAARKPTDA